MEKMNLVTQSEMIKFHWDAICYLGAQKQPDQEKSFLNFLIEGIGINGRSLVKPSSQGRPSGGHLQSTVTLQNILLSVRLM